MPGRENVQVTGDALSDIELIFKFANNGISGIRSIIPGIANMLETLAQSEGLDQRKYWAKQLDTMMDQMVLMARDSEIGGVNLLTHANCHFAIPSFVSDIYLNDECFRFATVGMSISSMREEVNDEVERFMGILILSSAEYESLMWLGSLNLWMENQPQSHWDEGAFVEEIERFGEALNRFDSMLVELESQFKQYAKKVGEIFTDSFVNS